MQYAVAFNNRVDNTAFTLSYASRRTPTAGRRQGQSV